MNIECRIVREAFDARPELRQPWWRWHNPGFGSLVAHATSTSSPVAVVRLFERGLARPGLRTLEVVGIGGVYTDEASRGRGVARALMQAAIDLADERRAEAVVLYARPRDLYVGLGFHPICGAGGEFLFVREGRRLPRVPLAAWVLIPSGHF